MAMLREPALYTKLSCDHLAQASKCIEKYGDRLTIRPGEAVMDIGCGPGDVTHDVILPSLHPSFSILVGIDISSDMIDFAKRRWTDDERLIFLAMDAAESDVTKIKQRLSTGTFNKIFSFYALQWISDRRQVAVNLSSFLAPGGQALLVLVVRNGIYTVWDAMVKCAKWSKFFKDVKVPLNEYQYMEDPANDLLRCLENAGLNVMTCESEFHGNAFSSNNETDKQKIERLRSVDPLVCLIPDDLKDAYLADVLLVTKSKVGPSGAVDYTSLTILCEKPASIDKNNKG